MARRISTLFLLFLLSALPFYVKGQLTSSQIHGRVTKGGGKPVPFANVVVKQNGRQVKGTSADAKGKFTIKPLDPGTYTLVATAAGFSKTTIEGIELGSDDVREIKVDLSTTVKGTTDVVRSRKPLIPNKPKEDVGKEDIEKMAARNVNDIAATVGGVYQSPGGGGVNVRGARNNSTDYYIDGVKITGSTNLPQSAIQNVSVTTGGVPAQYGDATGGIISISTRGPSSQYAGSFEAVSSGFKSGDQVFGLDKYGYNLVEGNITGPILDRDSGQPLLGFMLSANYTHQADRNPSGLDHWVIKDDVRDSLIQDPLRRGGPNRGAQQNAEFLRRDDFRKQAWRPNAYQDELSLSGKLDLNVKEGTNLTFGGNFNYNKRRRGFYNYSAFNYSNNPLFTDIDWRAFGKFSQSLDTDTGATLQDVYYQLQVDYSKETARREDAKHGSNLFAYGHIGRFRVHRERSYDYRDGYKVHTGFRDTLVTFEPSQKNQAMSAVTTQFFDIYDQPDDRYENFNQIRQNNGLLNGDRPASVYDIWTGLGDRFNSFRKVNNTQLRFTGRGSATIEGHELQIGFEYEQRVNRQFAVAPIGLWNRMRQLANFHLQELNTEDSIISQDGQYTQVDYRRKIGDDQTYFDEQLRKSLDLPVDGRKIVQTDAISPDHYSLDMFSADELLNQGSNYVSYYGYDHTGNKLDGEPTLEDFFRATEGGGGEGSDAGGVNTRPVGAYRPIYMAGYLMDEFVYDDIVFNVGVRVSRFDANQMVLKDKYLLKPAYTVGERPDLGGGHPSSLGDDAVIYVDDASDPTSINGYREGDDWYNAEGEPVDDPSVVEGPTGIQPLLKDPDQEASGSKISLDAFKDYEPQVNVLPRISFSFNVRENSKFFAHYDVLAKRPRSNVTRMNPLDYFYLENRDQNLNNPNLRPQKTIDYEVGFQQKLSDRSAVKISAFYREMRNMVQITRVVGAYPQSYKTYGNLDFGTVKGMTVKYDLRRLRSDNVRLRAYYTLQFANGTGSDFETQSNLINSNQPNLRTVTPLNFDQRHQFTITGDLRFYGGKRYNGPEVGENDVQILKNTGLNLQANFGSGTPYSALTFSLPTQTMGGGGTRAITGGINGSRKPWQFRVDAQIDRDIKLTFGGGDDDEGGKKTYDLNVYLRVDNLFNNLNVTNVYGYTGDATNDGYLSASRWQQQIEAKRDETSYRQMYRMKMNNPGNFGQPRVIRLGARVNF